MANSPRQVGSEQSERILSKGASGPVAPDIETGSPYAFCAKRHDPAEPVCPDACPLSNRHTGDLRAEAVLIVGGRVSDTEVFGNFSVQLSDTDL
jgi:hypothetical protein